MLTMFASLNHNIYASKKMTFKYINTNNKTKKKSTYSIVVEMCKASKYKNKIKNYSKNEKIVILHFKKNNLLQNSLFCSLGKKYKKTTKQALDFFVSKTKDDNVKKAYSDFRKEQNILTYIYIGASLKYKYKKVKIKGKIKYKKGKRLDDYERYCLLKDNITKEQINEITISYLKENFANTQKRAINAFKKKLDKSGFVTEFIFQVNSAKGLIENYCTLINKLNDINGWVNKIFRIYNRTPLKSFKYNAKQSVSENKYTKNFYNTLIKFYYKDKNLQKKYTIH